VSSSREDRTCRWRCPHSPPDLAVSITAVANDPIWLLRHCSHLELDEYWQGDDNAQTAALPFDGVACTIDPGEDDV
jgi:hypothetical protein